MTLHGPTVMAALANFIKCWKVFFNAIADDIEDDPLDKSSISVDDACFNISNTFRSRCNTLESKYMLVVVEDQLYNSVATRRSNRFNNMVIDSDRELPRAINLSACSNWEFPEKSRATHPADGVPIVAS